MSGGVDSSLAAALLKEQGYRVHGVYMKNWSSADPLHCPWQEEIDTASAVAKHLGIPFESWHLEEEYRKDVVEYMVAEYKAGRTPNPDVLCNEKIKFGIFLKKARAAGADMIATGHYVRLLADMANSKWQIANGLDHKPLAISYKLLRAVDKNKDQSYFLCRLTQEQLQYCLFPLGELTKPQVREEAHKRGLLNWDRKDSQGLCFVGKIDMGKFLQDFIKPQKGVAKLPDGTVVGEHMGAWYFTRGQRHGFTQHLKKGAGFSRSGTEPLYVVDRDLKTNTLVVAPRDYPGLYAMRIVVNNFHWIAGQIPLFPPFTKGDEGGFSACIRYRQVPAPCKASPCTTRRGLVEVSFSTPQFAPAPGQFVVLYNGQEMLGSGIIEKC